MPAIQIAGLRAAESVVFMGEALRDVIIDERRALAHGADHENSVYREKRDRGNCEAVLRLHLARRGQNGAPNLAPSIPRIGNCTIRSVSSA